MVDKGSQRLYITSKAVIWLKCEILREILVVYCFSGGFESHQQKYCHFKIHLTSLDETYTCYFEVLEREKISKALQSPWMKDLRKRCIKPTDSDIHISQAYKSEIHLL